MRSILVRCLVVLSVIGIAPVRAGVLADDLSRCMITKSSDADRNAFMGWMFSAISANPTLNKLANLDRAKRDQLSANAGAVMQRLLVVDCHKEAVAAIRSEGFDAVKQPFGALGESATEQMFRSSESQVELEALAKGFDSEKLKALGREAGIPEDQLNQVGK
jgi:hypothetical protein